MTKLSIVIPTINGLRFLKEGLNSIFSQDLSDSEVIVIDNGSQDGTVEFITDNYPQAILKINSGNLGVCKARNQGIEISKGEWILTLDCDVILTPQFLKNLLDFTNRQEKSIGAVQPKILYADKKTIYSCGIYLSFFRRFYDIGKSRPASDFDKPQEVFGACSAAALYRREMLEEVKEPTGYFDERFFFLVEDMDLSWRAQNRGWKTVFALEAICYHFGNSSGYNGKFRQYLCFRNRFYSIIKNEGLTRYFIKIFPWLFYDIPRFFYMLLTNPYMLKRRAEGRVN